MSVNSSEAPVAELLVEIGADPSAVANSEAPMADTIGNNRGEGEAKGGQKSDSIEGDGGDGEGRGKDSDLDSGEEQIDQLQSSTPPPALPPAVRRNTRSTSRRSQSNNQGKNPPPAKKPKAAPREKAKLTFTTCQKELTRDEGGGICDEDLDPETEVGKYKNCKTHRDIEAKKQQLCRQRKADAAVANGGSKRKREGGQKLAPQVSAN